MENRTLSAMKLKLRKGQISIDISNEEPVYFSNRFQLAQNHIQRIDWTEFIAHYQYLTRSGYQFVSDGT